MRRHDSCRDLLREVREFKAGIAMLAWFILAMMVTRDLFGTLWPLIAGIVLFAIGRAVWVTRHEPRWCGAYQSIHRRREPCQVTAPPAPVAWPAMGAALLAVAVFAGLTALAHGWLP
jgi:hypothetical protein